MDVEGPDEIESEREATNTHRPQADPVADKNLTRVVTQPVR